MVDTNTERKYFGSLLQTIQHPHKPANRINQPKITTRRHTHLCIHVKVQVLKFKNKDRLPDSKLKTLFGLLIQTIQQKIQEIA